jgi:hypothetical protein
MICQMHAAEVTAESHDHQLARAIGGATEQRRTAMWVLGFAADAGPCLKAHALTLSYASITDGRACAGRSAAVWMLRFSAPARALSASGKPALLRPHCPSEF